MAQNMNQLVGRLNSMLAALDNDGKTAKEIIEVLQNLRKTSENMEKITKGVEGVVGDPQTQQAAKDTMKNAKEASEKANKLLGVFTESDKETAFDVKYGDKPEEYRVDANWRINYAPRRFLSFGLADLGGENDLNLQFGYGTKAAALRAGLVLGEAGAGVDYSPSKWLRFFADAYDPNNFKVRVGGEVKFADRWSLVGEALDVRKKLGNSLYVGVRGYF
jgi:phospholipid/cholesterol/gamma-HCH transport system substrate-binding protein